MVTSHPHENSEYTYYMYICIIISFSYITDDADAKAAGCFCIILLATKSPMALIYWFILSEEVGKVRVKKCWGNFWSDWISMLPLILMFNNACFHFTVLFSCEIGFQRFGSMSGLVTCGSSFTRMLKFSGRGFFSFLSVTSQMKPLLQWQSRDL